MPIAAIQGERLHDGARDGVVEPDPRAKNDTIIHHDFHLKRSMRFPTEEQVREVGYLGRTERIKIEGSRRSGIQSGLDQQRRP